MVAFTRLDGRSESSLVDPLARGREAVASGGDERQIEGLVEGVVEGMVAEWSASERHVMMEAAQKRGDRRINSAE